MVMIAVKDKVLVPFMIFLTIGSFVLGIVAAFYGIKDTDTYIAVGNGHCTYATKYAAPIGITASFAILISQIMATTSAGCVLLVSRRVVPSRKISSIVCLVCSWLLALASFILLFIGGISNSSAARFEIRVDQSGANYCMVWKYKAMLIVGACLAIVATSCVLVHYWLSMVEATPVVPTLNARNTFRRNATIVARDP